MPLPVSMAELIREAISSRLADVHTALPGRVESYDGAKQVADVVPVIRGVVFSEQGDLLLEDLPVIPNVIVAWPRGGGYSLQFPLSKGDHGLLVFSEAATGQWRESGDISEPGDLRRHDLSYPIFVPCCAPSNSPLPSAGNAAVLDGPTLIRMGGELADFVANATKVMTALNALKSAISSAPTVPQDGGAAFKAALVTALSAWPPPLATTKFKAE